jgi:hypothetical protein
MTTPLSLEAATAATVATAAGAADRGTALAPAVTHAANVSAELDAGEAAEKAKAKADQDDKEGRAGEDHGGGSSMRFPRRMKRCVAQLREARIALKRLLTSYKKPPKKEVEELTGVEGALAKAAERVEGKRAVEAEAEAAAAEAEAKKKKKAEKKKKKKKPKTLEGGAAAGGTSDGK